MSKEQFATNSEDAIQAVSKLEGAIQSALLADTIEECEKEWENAARFRKVIVEALRSAPSETARISVEVPVCPNCSFAFPATAGTPVSATPWKPGDPRVVCAALRDASGRLVTGARHFDGVMMEQIMRGADTDAWRGAEQGFINQRGNFLTREEAHEIATRWGQILRRVGSDSMSLFSENLY